MKNDDLMVLSRIRNGESDSEVYRANYKNQDVVLKIFNIDNVNLIKESGIYRYIKTNILDKGICNNFVEFVDFIKRDGRYILITKNPDNSIFLSKIIHDRLEYSNLIFQLFCTIYIMHENGIHHNDLHSNNIIIERFQSPISIKFKIGNNNFEIFSKYLLKIFDFDRSEFNDNPNLSDLQMILTDDDIHPLVFPYKNLTRIDIDYLKRLYCNLYN